MTQGKGKKKGDEENGQKWKVEILRRRKERNREDGK